MMQDRVCRQCGRSFRGGPRAFYCSACRDGRRREANNKRRINGPKRPLGSTDKCERCGKEYTVNSGLQRFCPECKPIHAAEYDRETSIKFYHANKVRTNPIRYTRRHVGPKKCAWCGKEFKSSTCTNTCSMEHRREWINKWWRERYHKKKEVTK